MKSSSLAITNLGRRSLALALFLVASIPALALAQIDSASSSASHSAAASTTTTTTVASSLTSDWRFWALLGAVLLVILIIAMSRGRGNSGDRTTVVK
jgi:NADH:ubiquinone oxidoreductase subunit 6 (subunit J)